MALIRRVPVDNTGSAQAVPPDGADHAGLWNWTVLNTDAVATVELVDDPAKTVGQGFPLAPGAEWDTLGNDEHVWVVTSSVSAVSVAVAGTTVS